MMSTALSTLRQRLSEAIGDWFSSTVTTALAASTAVIDTALANVYGGDITDHFEDQWCLITSENNDGANRIVDTYATGTTALAVKGGNFTTDGANKATYELHLIDPNLKKKALNNAARELYPHLYRPVLDRNLIAGNILPDGSFEDWSSTSALTFYTTESNITLVQTTTAAYIRGQRGTTSAKATAGATNGYFAIASSAWPRLLDLQGHTVDFKAWAYPAAANDAKLQIYIEYADGTTSTLSSTTTSVANEWNLISLGNQSISNKALTTITFRFVTVTNGNAVYWDKARVTGPVIYDYVLPPNFSDGTVSKVRLQATGNASDACDDIGMVVWDNVFGWKVVEDGTYKYLRMPYWATGRMLELEGYRPLEDNLSSDTDTISLNDPYTNLLIAQAAWELFRMLRGFPSSASTQSYDEEINYWATKTAELKRRIRMPRLSTQIGWRI